MMPEPVPPGVTILKGERLIEGVRVVPLRRIPDERGTIHHMLRRTDPHFSEFGEIYFSTIYRNVIKGLAQAPGNDPELRVHCRTHQAGDL
jgi:dTDP-4-dehydrorhamnose 3,5-epimerase-like enzyme